MGTAFGGEVMRVSVAVRPLAGAVAMLCFVLVLLDPPRAVAEAPPAEYVWPVGGPVIQGFRAPPSPYEAGHRGIDIAAPLGTPVRASAGGTVAFAGSVAGSRFVSIDHPDGIRTTYSWLSAIEARGGQEVTPGAIIGSTGHGHPELERPHLHFGARRGSEYLDPLILLGVAAPAVHLAPLEPGDRSDPASGGAIASGGAAELPPSARALAGPDDWLWSRTEPKPLVLPGRAQPWGGP